MNKPIKKPHAKSRQQAADDLGTTYEAQHARHSEAGKALEQTKTDIKTFAEFEGEKDELKKTVKGTTFEVGYVEVPSYELNLEEARKRLGKSVFAKLYRKEEKVIETLDPLVFKALVDDGTINKQDAQNILKQVSSSKRILVKRL